MSLKPRERVLITLKHEEPDRIPIELGSTSVTSIHAKAYYDLRKYLGLPEKPPRIMHIGQQLAEVDKDILELFHIDIININRTLEPTTPYPYIHRFTSIIDGSLKEVSDREFYRWKTPYGIDVEIPKYVEIIVEDNNYAMYNYGKFFCLMPKNNYYCWWTIKPPLVDIKSIDDVKKFNWDSLKIPDNFIEILKKRAEHLYRNTDYALVNTFIGPHGVMGYHETGGQFLRGWDKWLSDLRTRKPLAEVILDYIHEIRMYNIKKIIDAIGEYIQIIQVGSDDFGTEVGPQISVETFREFYKFRYEELIGYVKKYSKAFTFLHSCGSIFPLIKEFIDVGLDIINPVQISAKGMEPEKLKKTYGDQITFWGGGADNQHMLPFAKPEELKEHVKKLIKVFAPKGGFIFANIRNIQPGVPTRKHSNDV